ncbi:hypothetical protein [Paraurantiacibacter namhicola]|uniref:DUF2127 domain-containing protein n=1 Tax=Paraurantiacibacter namhicola TaxID=645517 RepID=A0A1C7D5Q2_9SPHN|nr:hypothetical protein [Paraurantiacibacter namhicola]ANU06816.1 hypothetical protein A6F65_00491 [Paraurantiacibacter namhicola]
MKPASIKTFDILYLGSIAITIIATVLAWDGLMAATNAELARQGMEMGEGTNTLAMISAGFGIGIVVVIQLLLWAGASIWRAGWVKWLIAALALYSLATFFIGFGGDITLRTVLVAAARLMALGAAAMLFRADAKAWFAKDKA